MNIVFLLPLVAGVFSLLLAALSLLRRRSIASWCFFAGMAALGLDSVFTGLSLRAAQAGDLVAWLTPAFVAKAFVPALWLVFSLAYSRSNFHEFLRRWRWLIAGTALLPVVGIATLLRQVASADAVADSWWFQPGAATIAINVALLFVLVLILVNFEQTFRAAVGTMRWRIKFVLVALTVIFGARLYVRTQAILFSAPDIAFWSVESGALLIGCLLLAVAYARTGLAESDVYPSLAVLRSSFTVLIVGAYLFIVGVLAQLVSRFGGSEIFRFQALVVLVGMAGLAILLLSDRARQRIHIFIGRHFSKAQHDSVRIWMLVSQRLAAVSDQAALCSTSAKLISETFDALSVTIWLLDDEVEPLKLVASTGQRALADGAVASQSASFAIAAALQERPATFELDDVAEPWAEELRQLTPTTFPKGGARLCILLRSGERTVGVVVLADRVSGAVYTVEELELLKCIGDHVTSMLMNVRLATEVAQARELDAFRLMSTFFVHDLKNAASSLNLMLKNLPVHFDDPAFRADALRSIGNTAGRIDDMIARLSALRQRPDATRVEADLNQLVTEALNRVESAVAVTKQLQPLPTILADREEIQSVVTNLVLNARDAVGKDGLIQVRTQRDGGRVLLWVIDNGCGMSPTFVKESLFRPFQSTKKKGLGIGLFQSRAIVQAHGGGMHVQSEIGRGTTFQVSFPIKDAQ